MLRKLFIAGCVLLALIGLGLIGESDYQDELSTYNETVEIKQLMRQRHLNDEALRSMLNATGG